MMMKAIDRVNICPYTGLRSFTEEESLYFKGRDLQTDQIAALLEQNKFLMVTGASGEGKSSLIYGGLIPNVRAGFFKAKFTNWLIADFRPERSPVKQMSRALASQFNTEEATVETELRRGYSSLIDLYTNSGFYASEDELESLPDEKARQERKRKASNLLIIVDQFEEFFTNPENFFNETPSRDAQIVVNLVLETSRIAIRRNLPVYVICTMRSDYIGQCSAFRGLPEHIGFSQFFVPRLKRKDLKEVMEEPAVLSGNRIAQRLVERLVYDISDGVDQLPILQHALSRIWKSADDGREEMDLIHYAMVGGMPASELPDQDMERFREWKQGLPDYHQKLLEDTGLNKVIEIHANLLYETACSVYNSRYPDANIYPQEAKRIIALAFSCLTKIDNSRAVRNRMTLQEITDIINVPKLGTDVVGRVLSVFREEGNSFMRPFVTDDLATMELGPEAVLDITHESLIRNWNKLNQWANKEFEYLTVFQDFRKQMDRWKNSGKNSGYLLPIGPLNYFENWYNTCNPNKAWIRRYEDANLGEEEAGQLAEQTLKDTREFLKRSARKEMISRAFMKYGPRRIIAISALLIMTILTGYFWADAARKKNSRVIDQVRSEAFTLLVKPEVNIREKALYLLTEERYKTGSLISLLKQLPGRDKVMIGNEIYKQLLYIDKQKEDQLKVDLISMLDKDLEAMGKTEKPDWLLSEYNKLVILMSEDWYYNPEGKAAKLLAATAEKGVQWAHSMLGDTTLVAPQITTQINVAIQYWLSIGQPRTEQINQFIRLLAPEGKLPSGPAWRNYYPRDAIEVNGRMLVLHNAGFHTLTSLYAVLGDTAGVFSCFRAQTAIGQQDYFELARILNNHSNIAGFLYQYGHRRMVAPVIDWIATHSKNNPPMTLYRNAVLRGGYITHLYISNKDVNFYRSTKGYIYPNLYFMDRRYYDQLLQDYDSVILQQKVPAERNFLMAMQSKRKAMFYSKYWYDRKIRPDEQKLDNWLSASISYFRATDTAYLGGLQSTTSIYNTDGVRTRDIVRRDLFLYPDYRDGWFSWTYHTDYFLRYLLKTGQFNELYTSPADLQQFNFWLAKAYEWKIAMPTSSYSNGYPLPDSTLESLVSMVHAHPKGSQFDENLIQLVLANNAFEKSDTAKGYAAFKQLRLDKLPSLMNRYEYLERVFVRNMMSRLAGHLAVYGKHEDAKGLIAYFDTPNDKTVAYLSAAENVFRNNAGPATFDYLDSAYSASRMLDYSIPISGQIDPRYLQILVMSEIGSRDFDKEMSRLFASMPSGQQGAKSFLRVIGLAYEGNYYKAYKSIPNTLTETEDLFCRMSILTEACRTRESVQQNKDEWKRMDRHVYWPVIYYDFAPN